MRDYLYLGPVPCDEPCAQVGEPDFRARSTKEMNAYMEQLHRVFPNMEQNDVSVKILWQNHDFGTYGEVVVVYDDKNEASCDYAFEIEGDLPYYWDDIAKRKLGL